MRCGGVGRRCRICMRLPRRITRCISSNAPLLRAIPAPKLSPAMASISVQRITIPPSGHPAAALRRSTPHQCPVRTISVLGLSAADPVWQAGAALAMGQCLVACQQVRPHLDTRPQPCREALRPRYSHHRLPTPYQKSLVKSHRTQIGAWQTGHCGACYAPFSCRHFPAGVCVLSAAPPSFPVYSQGSPLKMH